MREIDDWQSRAVSSKDDPIDKEGFLRQIVSVRNCSASSVVFYEKDSLVFTRTDALE